MTFDQLWEISKDVYAHIVCFFKEEKKSSYPRSIFSALTAAISVVDFNSMLASDLFTFHEVLLNVMTYHDNITITRS